MGRQTATEMATNGITMTGKRKSRGESLCFLRGGHAPRGARPADDPAEAPHNRISIHSPLTGRDSRWRSHWCRRPHFNPLAHVGRDSGRWPRSVQSMTFQPTRPGQGETRCAYVARYTLKFQSTRPAWGETRQKTRRKQCPWYFNPLAPPGARPTMNPTTRFRMLFLSLRPHGTRRRVEAYERVFRRISIHSPRVGRDMQIRRTNPYLYISIHSPAWGETHLCTARHLEQAISIHSPRVGRDQRSKRSGRGKSISIH